MSRGYFGIGIYHGKTAANTGMLLRSAYVMGASFSFVIGSRYSREPTDTLNATAHCPLYEYDDFEQLLRHTPKGAKIIGIEQGGESLASFTHPHQAIYLLGAEDHGLPLGVAERCDRVVEIPTAKEMSLNVAVAGSILLWDRQLKAAMRQKVTS